MAIARTLPASLPRALATAPKKVTFASIPHVSLTFSGDVYDRRCIAVEPLTGRDMAALHLFRLSLPSNAAAAGRRLPTRGSVEVRRAAAASLAAARPPAHSPQPPPPPGAKADWINGLALAARFNANLNSDAAASFVDASLNTVWERVDRCSSQLLRCL